MLLLYPGQLAVRPFLLTSGDGMKPSVCTRVILARRSHSRHVHNRLNKSDNLLSAEAAASTRRPSLLRNIKGSYW